jgi:hypothetical protein
MATNNTLNNIFKSMWGTPTLTGLSFPSCYQSQLPIAVNDVYTAPAGKRAFIYNLRVFNSGGSLSRATTFFKSGGNYYQVAAIQSFNATTGGYLLSYPLILEPGESIAVQANNTGLNVWGDIIQYDSTTGPKMVSVLALANGNNTIYTVPAGKTAMILPVNGSYNQQILPNIRIFNSSGGTRTYTMYFVPSGGSPGSTNQCTIAKTAATSNYLSLSSGFSSTLAAGDFVVINTDSGTASQYAFLLVQEI